MNHANGIPNVSHKRLEEVLLQVAYQDPQCLFLARGVHAVSTVLTYEPQSVQVLVA